MKKTLLVILALVMALALVMGSVSMVNAAPPSQVIGVGLMTDEDSTVPSVSINFQARLIDPDTAEATGLLRETVAEENFTITADILYLAVSEDKSKAWIGMVIVYPEEELELEVIFEVSDDGQMSSAYPLNILNAIGNFDYSSIQEAVQDMPDLFDISYLTLTLTQIKIR